MQSRREARRISRRSDDPRIAVVIENKFRRNRRHPLVSIGGNLGLRPIVELWTIAVNKVGRFLETARRWSATGIKYAIVMLPAHPPQKGFRRYQTMSPSPLRLAHSRWPARYPESPVRASRPPIPMWRRVMSGIDCHTTPSQLPRTVNAAIAFRKAMSPPFHGRGDG